MFCKPQIPQTLNKFRFVVFSKFEEFYTVIFSGFQSKVLLLSQQSHQEDSLDLSFQNCRVKVNMVLNIPVLVGPRA